MCYSTHLWWEISISRSGKTIFWFRNLTWKWSADDLVYNMAATRYASQNPEIRYDVIISCVRIVRLVFNLSQFRDSPQNIRFRDGKKCGFTLSVWKNWQDWGFAGLPPIIMNRFCHFNWTDSSYTHTFKEITGKTHRFTSLEDLFWLSPRNRKLPIRLRNVRILVSDWLERCFGAKFLTNELHQTYMTSEYIIK